MQIPQKVTIAGIEVDIEINPELIKKHGKVGISDYEEQVITIDPNVGNDIMKQTYLHEVTHYILYVMGNVELMKDERFVDGFSHLLYQAIK